MDFRMQGSTMVIQQLEKEQEEGKEIVKQAVEETEEAVRGK